MSFLLDALRKSERTGRSREAPTIHSPAPSPTPAGRGQDWFPMLLLLAPSFLLMGWLGLQQYGVFSGLAPSPEPQVTQVAPGAGGSTAASGGTGVETPRQQAAETGGATVEPESSPARGRRTPVEQAPVPAPGAKPVRKTSPVPAAATETAEPETAGTDPAVSTEPRRDAATPPAQTPRQNHVDYWDLPGNIRGQLPEFRISVLVYAEDPSERFILVNGQRQYEGDALQPGLVLDEIRLDGAVYSYRRYRFLVRQ